MTEKKHGFPNKEHLKGKNEISRVMTDGIFLFSKHIKLCYFKHSDPANKINKLAVSVPKKMFKSAVKRNRIKRQMREIYRLNKSIIFDYSEKNDIYFDMMLIYRSKETIPYKKTESEIKKLLIQVK